MAKNLWRSGRAARNEARQGEKEAFPPAAAEYESVGAILRKKREEHGEDLRYVAQILRIRYPYLKAIEDGHPDELPGPTYAVGFVRTYADHLGLESEKLVQQFKEEAAGLQSRADLHFPAPLPEGKIPSGAMLVMAVVLAAIVYGAWIYLSSRDQQVAELVPQLPDRISDIIKGKPGATAGKSPADVATASTQSVVETAPPATTLAPEKPDTTPKVEAAQKEQKERTPVAGQETTPLVGQETMQAAAPSPAPVETAPAVTVQPETPAASSVRPGVAAAPPEPRTSEAIPQPPGVRTDSSETDVTPPPTVVMTPQEPAGSQPAPTTGTPSDPDRAPPKTYGEQNTGARIVIHAAADSWVEVRDSTTDELLLTRVLFKGDKYQVPDRGGLTLLTGNAGGLRIMVDGAAAPAIGPLGAVRRNVLLDPSALLAGNATRSVTGGSGPADSQTSDSGLQVQ